MYMSPPDERELGEYVGERMGMRRRRRGGDRIHLDLRMCRVHLLA
jgi:hypothetical protein